MLYEHFKEAKPTTRKDIEDLAQQNPIVAHVLNATSSGHITFDQAMMEAVILLAKHNSRLENDLLDHMIATTHPLVIKLES
jgi:hypothetical protein